VEKPLILVRREGDENDWLTITYVPNGTSIKEKMTYAATKGYLLKELGYQHFADEMHANDDLELSWSNYSGTLKPSQAFTESEISLQSQNKEEKEEIEFRAKLFEEKKNAGGGGLHTVQLAFDQSAKQLVEKFKNGTHSFVELKISANKKEIEGISGSHCTSGSLSSNINQTEPRFYLFNFQGKNLFLYYCPNSASPNLKTVYATANPNCAAQISGLGVKIHHKMEGSEPSDFSSDNISDSVNPKSAQQRVAAGASAGLMPGAASQPSWAVKRSQELAKGMKDSDQTVVANAAPRLEQEHPIYGLMHDRNPNRQSKRIVIPPKGAW